MMAIEILNAFQRRAVRSVPKGESLTRQSEADSTDINRIMEKYQRTGMLPMSQMRPQWGDVSNALDYQASLNAVMSAQEAFNELPAKVRARFQNDPAALLSFVENSENYDEAVSLGLVPKKEETQPVPEKQPATDAGASDASA